MLKLIEANEKDVQLYYDWANDPSVRANSLNSDPIAFENHQVWFQKRLKNTDVHLFILVNDELKIGQIRLEKEEKLWNINYSISSEFRGKGMGKKIIELIVEKFPNYHFMARVQKNNHASLKIFEQLKFQCIKNDEIVIFEFHPK